VSYKNEDKLSFYFLKTHYVICKKNHDFISNFLNSYSNPNPKLNFFFCFTKLSYSIFARDLQNTHTQTPKKLKTQAQTFGFIG